MLRAPAFTVPSEQGKTPHMPLGINSIADTDICHTKQYDGTSHMHLTYYSDINSVVGAYHHPVPTDVGNKV